MHVTVTAELAAFDLPPLETSEERVASADCCTSLAPFDGTACPPGICNRSGRYRRARHLAAWHLNLEGNLDAKRGARAYAECERMLVERSTKARRAIATVRSVGRVHPGREIDRVLFGVGARRELHAGVVGGSKPEPGGHCSVFLQARPSQTSSRPQVCCSGTQAACCPSTTSCSPGGQPSF